MASPSASSFVLVSSELITDLLPMRIDFPSQAPETLPSCWTKSEASFKERFSALAPSTIAVAKGCSDFCSTEAESASNSSGFTFPKAITSVKEGLPEVTVPVLSKTTASTFSKDSIASALLNRMPFLAPRPVPTMMAVGVAKPNAHGQEITRTDTAISSANSQE